MRRLLYYRGEEAVIVSSDRVQDETLQCIEIEGELPFELKDCRVRDGKILNRNEMPLGLLRVAVVSDYKINCGIATYTEYLTDAMRAQVGEVRIFAEDADGAVDEPGVVRCWSRKGDYSRIIEPLIAYNPDLVIVQHEFGLFHRVDQFACLMSQLQRFRTIVTLHTVLDHNVPNADAKRDYLTRSLTEASCREVIVHTPKAREVMRDRGFSGEVHVIPHGCFAPDRSPKLPSTRYGMFPEHSIFQYGFGGTHKGWQTALEVVGLLKERYPNLIYVGVFNVTDFADEGQIKYHHKLLDEIRKRGLEKNAAILRGFQSEQMLRYYLKSSRVAIFPYQRPNVNWASWGASGAIQLPLSLGIPTLLSDFPAFQEFEGRLPVCRSPMEFAHEIDRIWSDPGYEKGLSEQSFGVSEERRWEKIARLYLTCPVGKDSDPCRNESAS